jgi:hypothetical protein
MKFKVGVFGIGQLGTRYLEGLLKANIPLEIFAYDLSDQALMSAYKKLEEIYRSQNFHSILFSTDITRLSSELDLAIISSTADTRVNLSLNLKSRCTVKNWLLEKVLAQSSLELTQIAQLTDNGSCAWVNTPMYLWPLYKNIRSSSPSHGPIRVEFIGINGLACNAIHYIDLVSRWNNSRILDIETINLNNSWYAAKRDGFYEIDGELKVYFSDSSTLILRTNEIERLIGYRATIDTTSNTKWIINEKNGNAFSSCGKKVYGDVLLQSIATKDLVESILMHQSCNLPSLAESINQHRPLIDSLLIHWNSTNISTSNTLPIT